MSYLANSDNWIAWLFFGLGIFFIYLTFFVKSPGMIDPYKRWFRVRYLDSFFFSPLLGTVGLKIVMTVRSLLIIWCFFSISFFIAEYF